MAAIRLALIGLGKIAVDSHIPAIRATPEIELVAVSSPHAGPMDGMRSYTDHREMLAAGGIDAVAVCTPTQLHYQVACDCFAAGVDVLLEKPPAATLSAFEALIAQAQAAGRVLFAAWHARFAAGVEAARSALAKRTVSAVDIVWREDVRRWHRGQQWIWTAGGFGVFDPGINALSIATRILPQHLLLDHAALDFPAGRDAPIAARLGFIGLRGGADFDWRPAGDPVWTITVISDGAPLVLSHGGHRLTIGGAAVALAPVVEYEGVYRTFVELLRTRRSDADAAPLRLAADAFLIGARRTVEAFVEPPPP